MIATSVQPAPVSLSRDGTIAIVTIDNPPVNAGSAQVRAGLLSAVAEVTNSPEYDGAIIIGAGKSFIAGSDLREFDLPLVEPQLPAIIAAIEASPKPFIAALHGAALGGGYELALGCDARMAAPGTVVGLPETTLGIIPGAGGTQRLPRLVGTAMAIDIICSGRRVEASEAIELGMIDAICAHDLKQSALDYARTFARSGRKDRVIERILPDCEDAAVAGAEAAAMKRGRFRPHIVKAIEHIKAAGHVAADIGRAQERATFQALRTAPEAKALRHLFFAERQARRSRFAVSGQKRPIQRVGVVGAGTMGAGIAMALLDAGLAVTLTDAAPAALARGAKNISDWLEKRVATGRLSRDRADARLNKLVSSLEVEDLANSELIVEAVLEDISVKARLFEKLGALTPAGTLLATNTSYLDVDAIARASGRPEDVLGLHFFSPAHVMPLLEIVQGQQTSPDAIATALALSDRLGKQPIVARNSFGFIGNRLYAAYRRECEFMLEDGALPHDVDEALERFGMGMGPFAVGDMSGLDIAWRMRQARAATRDPAARYVTIPDQLCEAGRFGRKAGAGYYRYAADGQRQNDPVVENLIVEASRGAGRVRSPIAPETIVRRALIALANEAALLIEEGVTETSETVDVAMVNGYGFPRWVGGPVHWARNQDAAELARDRDEMVLAATGAARKGDLTRIGCVVS